MYFFPEDSYPLKRCLSGQALCFLRLSSPASDSTQYPKINIQFAAYNREDLWRNLDNNSIDLAIVTPSLVIIGGLT